MSHSHASSGWIRAKLMWFRFSADHIEKEHLRSHNSFRKIHHKAGVIGTGHVRLDRGYFEDIAEALQGVQGWMLTGPGTAKDEMARHIEEHRPDLKRTLCGLQSSDHPTDGELIDQARRAFRSIDRMRPNSVAG